MCPAAGGTRWPAAARRSAAASERSSTATGGMDYSDAARTLDRTYCQRTWQLGSTDGVIHVSGCCAATHKCQASIGGGSVLRELCTFFYYINNTCGCNALPSQVVKPLCSSPVIQPLPLVLRDLEEYLTPEITNLYVELERMQSKIGTVLLTQHKHTSSHHHLFALAS